MMNNEEKWVECWEFPNYEVSSLGNIRNAKTGKVLKKIDDGKKYELITLFYNKKKHTRRVQRLIWESFNQCDCKETIDHIDRIRNNNSIDNLRCIPISEQYKNRNPSKKSNIYHLNDRLKKEIQTRYEAGEWSTWKISRLFSIPINYIQTVMKRGSWKKYLTDEKL